MGAPQVQGIVSNNLKLPSDPQKVFVYGTLKKGHGNHERHLAGAKDLGSSAVEGMLFHLGGFPALCVEEKFTTVAGEVYEVNWPMLLQMDILEGVKNGFYSRIQLDVKPQGRVWTYVFTRDKFDGYENHRLIPSGIWRGAQMTPSVAWLGFGQGVEVGRFETNLGANEIRIGDGGSNWQLKRDPEKNVYVFMDKRDGTVLGEYKYLRDMTGAKPTLRLPPVVSAPPQNPPVTEATVRNHPTIKEIVEGRVRNLRRDVTETTPIVPWVGSKVEKEPEIPQSAKFYGIKVKEA
jgi:gamma-glutamylcyclotransferase (GGCT)/AIG2-like uncharacterized protein YtfP